MGAIAFDIALSSAQQHPHSRHGCLAVQHVGPRRHCFVPCSQPPRNEDRNSDGNGNDECPSPRRRRDFLLPFAGGTVSGVLRWNMLGLGLELPSLAEESSSAAPDYTITDKVYLEITKCPSISITSRESGPVPSERQGAVSASPADTYTASILISSSSSSIPSLPRASSSSLTSSSSNYCSDGELLGRIIIGLYGKQVPETVANFKAMCTGQAGSSYRGSLIHRILAGQYIMAGKQGFSKEKGEVLPPANLKRNMESVKSDAFKMPHLRPGTVSLCLSENDDEDQFRLDPEYRNVEFLITTGPGPAPRLNNKNIVFGTVLEGLDVILAAAAVPTYKPSERIRQFNELASFLGDERALNARSIWNRPLKALYISDCGEL